MKLCSTFLSALKAKLTTTTTKMRFYPLSFTQRNDFGMGNRILGSASC